MINIPDNYDALLKLFKTLDIPTDEIGFYNHRSFIRAERRNVSFIELYAAFVRLRSREASYDDHVRKTVPIVAKILAEEILSDGQLGACVDAAQILNKILEELGIWSYSIQGAIKIDAPELPNSTHFWLFDEKPMPGHVWVVAPPYEIIDVTLNAQPYSRNEAELLPQFLISEGGKRVEPNALDFTEPMMLAMQHKMLGGSLRNVHKRTNPGMMSAVNFFPSWELKEGSTLLRYATGGVSLSDAPNLAAIKNRTWNGRYAVAVLNDLILPALEAETHKEN